MSKLSTYGLPSRLAIGDLEFIRAALHGALDVLDRTLPPRSLRVRFRRPANPYGPGDEADLPARHAVAAIQRGDAELVTEREAGR